MFFTITCAGFWHQRRLLADFHQHQLTAASEEGVGENNFAFLQPRSKVLAIHSPFAQQFSCMDEVVHLPLDERGFLLLVAFYFCLRWSHAGGLRASLQVPLSQKVLSASTMSVFWSSCSSPGERPLHLPLPPIPFYGWKGPLPCLLLPALFAFKPFQVKMAIFCE